MNTRLSIQLLILFLLSLPLRAPSQPRSAVIALPDWGIDSVGSLRLGQCSLVRDGAGSRLEVQSLFDASAFAPNNSDTAAILSVADFNGQFINLLGGTSSTFAGNGASASAAHSISRNRVEAVTVTFDKGSDGYCGYWMHLFNSAAPSDRRRYLDADPYAYLVFAIRGESGTERVRLKIADEDWNLKEDAMIVGDCGQYTPGGHITTSWQIARVPLQYVPADLNRRKLAAIVFEALSPSKGVFEIGPLSFTHDAHFMPVRLQSDSLSNHPLKRALWVWDTKAILHNKGEDSLLQFLRLEHVSDVYLSLPYDPSVSVSEAGVSLDKETLGPLLQMLNAAGMRVHALTGDKDFIAPEAAEFVRNTIRHIVQYNASVPPGRQFFGIHLDVEPYLIPGFTSPKQPWYLGRFLKIMNECAEIAHDGNLQIGADIPPWYDSANEVTHQHMRTDALTTKPFYQELFDILDNITLMDYRTTVEGDNGLVMFAVKELEYAEEHGKEVFVGLETLPLPDETIVTFTDPVRKGIPQQVPVLIIMEEANHKAEFTLVHTADELDGWLQKKQHREGMYYWQPTRTSEVPASKSTFAALGKQKLEEAIQQAESSFRRYRSFAGYAIHSYRSYSILGK